ncbi:hypothetical protein J9N36_004429 [Salmonella enterica]|uniref:Uncharacterized protein n=1 Tax=Salmonella newport TaxID=108619 RepID=A0A5U9VPV7_SALNE|nr:hypothetical protein [Salmonella enterica subsp. enterica serovar Newport]ECB3302038.1 hypothetical protein [Salmonella enterica subsp. enterica serovar Newport]EHI3122992.1 hypothetical protein [Salmonella enterica]
MPDNNYDSETTYYDMNISKEVLDDLHSFLATHSENLQEKLLLLSVVTHSLMTAQNLEYFESLLPCGHRIHFINSETQELLSSPENIPPYFH